jgi:hypothetical protein
LKVAAPQPDFQISGRSDIGGALAGHSPFSYSEGDKNFGAFQNPDFGNLETAPMTTTGAQAALSVSAEAALSNENVTLHFLHTSQP